MNFGLANGSPKILVSERLRNEESIVTCGLRVCLFRADTGAKLSFEDNWPFPPADTIIAIVADEAERLELAQVFSVLERTVPPFLIRPSPTEIAAKIVGVMLAHLTEASTSIP